jgi:hypothetical protein
MGTTRALSSVRNQLSEQIFMEILRTEVLGDTATNLPTNKRKKSADQTTTAAIQPNAIAKNNLQRRNE